ncbi:PTS sugar transporter subunit IIB [Gracilibacillus alcaliphilus]|uniref:PTS sugar transporter subunit IIB n=1 Tax=Gracilibacillus alcaliphilus TaxID=1401441 RepID=UPI00195CD456|nr:PTS sugar transporter subunit IIB [Gracilibacillus alcaliphilus]MBM7675511.1 PTS system cellobiose-specific IIB component [Gracilibacillus alcaliphilus]
MRVVLVCSAGMSTSILVERMKEAAEEQQVYLNVKAVAESDLRDNLHELDVVLIGPQVRYLEKSIKEKVEPTGAKCDVINQQAFGLMQGKQVLEQALNLMASND